MNDGKDQSSSPYAGLINAGMTCYMNSLLQILYMTPEFRCKVYSLCRTESQASIPYQLQLLFARMQLIPQKSIETEGLWRSFNWDWEHVSQQQDAIEFCQALFEALEKSLSDAQEKRLISDVFGGEMAGYVQCQSCSYASNTMESFQDLSLPVRLGSIEKAIRTSFLPETLAYENQYFCGVCGVRRDAIKGYRLETLPPVLMIQLKRFGMDAPQRRKLHDYVSFPEILDMNPYFHPERVSNRY